MSAVLALDEFGNVFHWAGAVEGVHGYEVLEHRGLELAKVALHAGTFELEGADGGAARVEVVGIPVVERYVVDIEVYAAVFFDVRHRLADYGEGFQTQKVHFNQTGRLDDAAFVLGDKDFVAVFVGGGAHGHPVGDVVAAYYHAAGMDTGVPYRALEALGIVHDFGDGRLFHCRLEVIEILNAVAQIEFEFLFLVRVCGVDGHVAGHQLCQGVAAVYGIVHHARHVLDCHFCGHGAIGDDVSHVGGAVSARDVVEHVLAAVIVEVYVDIGQRYAVRVEETFEQQIVLQRIDLRNSQAVCHHRAGGGATPRAYAHAHAASLADKVLHDEEVAGKAHGFHYVELKAYAFLYVGSQGGTVSARGALEGEFFKIVGFEFYAVELVVSAEGGYLLVGGFF